MVVFATTTSLFKEVRGQIHAIEIGIWDQVESNHKKALEAIEDGAHQHPACHFYLVSATKVNLDVGQPEAALRQLWHVVYAFVFVDTNLLFN